MRAFLKRNAEALPILLPGFVLLFDVFARDTPKTVKASGGQTPTFSIFRKAGIACCSDVDLLSRIGPHLPGTREGSAFRKTRK